MKVIMDNDELVYNAATNPLLAVRLVKGPHLPRPGYPEVLQWKKATPALDIWCLQEDLYRVIQDLPGPLRKVILACYGEGCSFAAYAKRISRSRERARQLEASALRKMRGRLTCADKLREATEVVPVPGSSLDPDWVNTKEAARLTGYTREHVRWLCRKSKVVCQINPLDRRKLQLSKKSLQAHILAGQGDGRRTGEWREHREQA